MNIQRDEDDFNEWVDNFFDLDPMMLNIVYLLYEAYLNKQTTGIGVIVETEPPKKKSTEKDKMLKDLIESATRLEELEKQEDLTEISTNEIVELFSFLSEKGLQFKHKRDTI